LINAYKSSTHEALENCDIIRRYMTDAFEIGYSFDQTGPVMRALNEIEVNIDENGYSTGPFVRVTIRKSLSENLKIKLLSLILKRDESDITGEEEVEGFYLKAI